MDSKFIFNIHWNINDINFTDFIFLFNTLYNKGYYLKCHFLINGELQNETKQQIIDFFKAKKHLFSIKELDVIIETNYSYRNNLLEFYEDNEIKDLFTFKYILEKEDFLQNINKKSITEKFLFCYNDFDDSYNFIQEQCEKLKDQSDLYIKFICTKQDIALIDIQKYQFIRNKYSDYLNLQFKDIDNFQFQNLINVYIKDNNKIYFGNTYIDLLENLKPFLVPSYILSYSESFLIQSNNFFKNGFLNFYENLAEKEKNTIIIYLNFIIKDSPMNTTIKDYYNL